MKTSKIEVRPDKKGGPHMFIWRDRPHIITEVHEKWRETGHWWAGATERTLYRVQTADRGIYKIAYDHAHNSWQMVTVED